MTAHQVGIDWGDTDDDEDEGLNEDECIIDERGSPIKVDE